MLKFIKKSLTLFVKFSMLFELESEFTLNWINMLSRLAIIGTLIGICLAAEQTFKFFIFREDCLNEFLKFNIFHSDCIGIVRNITLDHFKMSWIWNYPWINARESPSNDQYHQGRICWRACSFYVLHGDGNLHDFNFLCDFKECPIFNIWRERVSIWLNDYHRFLSLDLQQRSWDWA